MLISEAASHWSCSIIPDQDRYLKDLLIDESWSSDLILVDAKEAEAFARQYDPQPIHFDPEAAASGPFGGLTVSGWFVCALVMRDFATSRPFGKTTIFGMGIDELRWLEPVRPGTVFPSNDAL